MKRIYLDNASTTPLYPEVITEMTSVLSEIYGNPSSSHQIGREAKSKLELCRKSIAATLNCSSQEIIFTSCATEANNLIIQSAVKSLGIQRIITTKIEHHAVLHTIEKLQEQHNLRVDYVTLTEDGTLDYNHLEQLLEIPTKTLVALMYVNNETGTVLEITKVAELTQKKQAYFLSDAVQAVGKTPLDLTNLPVDFLVASAHKFHGPKGIGFAFIRKNIALQPIFFGGEQEKGLRAGTESLHNISGMAKALEISHQNLENDKKHILEVKKHLVEQITIHFPDAIFAGNPEKTQHNIINIILPLDENKAGMIVFLMDMKGIAISRGSACQSGSPKPSHVLQEFIPKQHLNKPNMRISLSKYNSKTDIDSLIQAIKTL